jgi:hypothetical protein
LETNRECLVPGFLPSRSALRFSNHFPTVPVLTISLPALSAVPIGDASRGLCGGMVFTVRDLHETGQEPPPDLEPPAGGTPLFRYVVRRLFDSFNLPAGPLKYIAWQGLADTDSWYARGLLTRTFHEEWPRVRSELDRGRLSAIGFIRHRSANPLRIGENHQVLVYGYRCEPATGEITLRIYDPNYGPCDDLTMTLDPAGPAGGGVVYSTGERVRGFFHTPYRRPQNGIGKRLPRGW